MTLRLVGKAVLWSLHAVTIVLVISGLGMTEYRTIEPPTLGARAALDTISTIAGSSRITWAACWSLVEVKKE
jgi:multisubunit Na+/H+ antiporter MnhF subunit